MDREEAFIGEALVDGPEAGEAFLLVLVLAPGFLRIGHDADDLRAKALHAGDGSIDLGKGDVDWRSAKTAVYVFNAGEDVLQVAKEAYSLYQSENGLGPMAFPSLKRMESEVISMGLSLLNAPEGGCGNMTSGGSESIFMAVKTCRDQARAEGRPSADGELLLPQSAHPAFDKAAHYLGLTVKRIGGPAYVAAHWALLFGLILLYQYTPLEIEWIGLVVIGIYCAIYALTFIRRDALIGATESEIADHG